MAAALTGCSLFIETMRRAVPPPAGLLNCIQQCGNRLLTGGDGINTHRVPE